MSLITETNEEYYAGQHSFVGDGVTTEFPTTFPFLIPDPDPLDFKSGS